MRKSPVPLSLSGDLVRGRGIFFMAASPRGSVEINTHLLTHGSFTMRI